MYFLGKVYCILLAGSEKKMARLGFSSLLGEGDRPVAFTRSDVLQYFLSLGLKSLLSERSFSWYFLPAEMSWLLFSKELVAHWYQFHLLFSSSKLSRKFLF